MVVQVCYVLSWDTVGAQIDDYKVKKQRMGQEPVATRLDNT